MVEDKNVAALRLLVEPTLPVNAPGFLVRLVEQHSKLLDGGQTSLSFAEWLWYHRGVDHIWGSEIEALVTKMVSVPELEKVVHPAHYGGEGVYETINVINALGWGREFCLGNALKYLMRAGNKPGEPETDDLRKAIRYIELYLETLEKSDGQV